MNKIFGICCLFLSCLAFRAEAVTLAWDASSTPGVQYRVKWGFASGAVNHTHVVEAGTALTVDINEPWSPGVTVWFTAYAWNIGGESVPSNEVSYMIPLPPTPTPMPTATPTPTPPPPTPIPTPEPPTDLRLIIEAVLNWWRSLFG